MKLILLPVLLILAAICSLGGPRRWDGQSEWRAESRRARAEARRSVSQARRAAMESRMEMEREKRDFLREMKRQEMQVRRDVREAFRYR